VAVPPLCAGDMTFGLSVADALAASDGRVRDGQRADEGMRKPWNEMRWIVAKAALVVAFGVYPTLAGWLTLGTLAVIQKTS
jgi:hypothetical protein